MAVNIHITIIELNALHTKRQNLFQELDAVIHLLMEAKHWGFRKSRNATSLNSRFKILETLKLQPSSALFPYTTLFRSSSGCGRRSRSGTTSTSGWSGPGGDRKSTRLNSSHRTTSYAVFCLKKNIKLGEHIVALCQFIH